MEKPSYEKLLEAAKNEKWEFVDANLSEQMADAHLQEAIVGVQVESNDNLQDFDSTVIFVSNAPLDSEDEKSLEAFIEDEDEYRIARYRVAMGLYKRGNRTEGVIRAVEEAVDDPDVGELARKLLA